MEESHPLQMDQTDNCDIQAARKGDESAFARLVRRHQTAVFAHMWRFTRDRRMLEELVQDVFVEAYLSLRTYRGLGPFAHWLQRIATRVGYAHWKREARVRRHRELLQERASEFPQTSEITTTSEAGEMLYKLLEQLPAKDRLVLTLYYFEEWDTNEIGRHLGWSAVRVRVRMHRAFRKLRALLPERPKEDE